MAASMKTALIISILVIIFVAIIVAFQRQPDSQLAPVLPTRRITPETVLTGPDAKADGPYASVEGFCGLGSCVAGPMGL